MNWSAVVGLLLKLVVWLVKNKLDDFKQRQLGYDQAVQEALKVLNERVKVANQIDEDSLGWGATDVDERLQQHYRVDDPADGKDNGGDK